MKDNKMDKLQVLKRKLNICKHYFIISTFLLPVILISNLNCIGVLIWNSLYKFDSTLFDTGSDPNCDSNLGAALTAVLSLFLIIIIPIMNMVTTGIIYFILKYKLRKITTN